MRVGYCSTTMRKVIVEIIRAARSSGKCCLADVKRPYVWSHVKCSNNTDNETMVTTSDFCPTDFSSWVQLSDANPETEYRCFVSTETDEYGDEYFRFDLKSRVLADDRVWLDNLVDIGLNFCTTESASLRVYKKTGLFLNEQQLAEIIKICGENE